MYLKITFRNLNNLISHFHKSIPIAMISDFSLPDNSVELLLNAIQSLVIILDKKGKVVFINTACEKLSGYTFSELNGKDICEILVHSQDIKSVKNILNEIISLKQSKNFENHWITKNGDSKYIAWSNNPVFDNKKEIIYFICTGHDLTEEKKISEQLNASEKKYDILATTIHDIIFIINENYIIEYVNEFASKMIGSKPSDIIGKDLSLFVPPEGDFIEYKNVQKVLNTGKPLIVNTKTPLGDNVFWLSTSFSPLPFEQGQPKRVIGISRDITNFKTTEFALIESEKKFRELIDHAVDTILQGDSKGNIIGANNIATLLTGYSKEELLSKNISTLFSEEVLIKNPLRYDLLQKGETVFNARNLTRKDGTLVPIEMNTKMLPDKTYQTFIRDVTNLKNKENQLRESEERYRTLIEICPDGIITHSKGIINYANPVALRLFGTDDETKVIGKKALDFVHPDYHKVVSSRMNYLYNPFAHTAPLVEEKFYRIDGTLMDVEVIASPFNFKDTVVVMVVFRDISERKKSEEMLNMMKFTLDHAADSAFWADEFGKIVYANDMACKKLGYSHDELYMLHAFDLDPQVTKDNWSQNWQKVVELKHLNFESTQKTKQGVIFPTEVSLNYLEFGEKKFLFSFIKDISQRKKIQEELILNDARIEALLKLSQLVTDNDQEIIDFALEEGTKLAKSQMGLLFIIDYASHKINMHSISKDILAEFKMEKKPTSFPMDSENLLTLPLKTGKPIFVNNYETYENKKSGLPNGHIKINNYLGIPIFDGGQTVAIIGVSNKPEDYTESDSKQLTLLFEEMWKILQRKKIEQTLKENQERLQYVIDATNDIVWDWDLKNNKIVYSSKFNEWLGYTIDENNLCYYQWSQIVHADDYNEFETKINDHLKGKTEYFLFEHRLKTKETKPKWMLNRGKVVEYDNNGKALRLAGTISDISSRKKAELKLLQSEERFRALAENSPVGICVYEKMFLYTNPACEMLSGYSKEELLKMNFWEIVHPIFRGEVIKRGTERFSGKKVSNNFEVKIIRKDGVERWFTFSGVPVVYNEINAAIGIIIDITERKKTEESLKSTNEELEDIIKIRTQELEMINSELKNEVSEKKKAEDYINEQLREKEVLLKEIHHRVKNNMQIIISLLNLQSSSIKSQEILNIFNDSQSRIKAMALIHEKLYQSKKFSHIDFSEYIKTLTNYLFLTFNAEKSHVLLQIEASPIPIEIDTAVSLGLITNELVTNCFKYAFKPTHQNPIISIALYPSTTNDLVLIVKDNGVGLPAKLNFRETDSLGLQLVVTLTEQISGKIEVESSANGTAFKIVFPQKLKL